MVALSEIISIDNVDGFFLYAILENFHGGFKIGREGVTKKF